MALPEDRVKREFDKFIETSDGKVALRLVLADASDMRPQYFLGTDATGSNPGKVLTVTVATQLGSVAVYKSGLILHSDDFDVVHSATSAVITFNVTVNDDEEIVVVGYR